MSYKSLIAFIKSTHLDLFLFLASLFAKFLRSEINVTCRKNNWPSKI